MKLSLRLLPILFLTAASTLSSYAQVDSSIYYEINQHIDHAKKLYAPDKRTKLIELVTANISNNTYSIQTTEPAAISYLKEKISSASKLEYILLPDLRMNQQTTGVVNLSVANLRTEPNHAAEMATQVLLGTKVDILQKSGGDYRVRTPEGYIAWVNASSITAMDEKTLEDWNKKKKLIYTSEFGRSYSQPHTNSIRISDLVYGNIVAIEDESKDYYKVSYPDQRIAYVIKNEAKPFDKWLAAVKSTQENILSSAKSMIGLPYLWGGTSVKGVDCSGFTKTSYFMNGYIIPRDASQQVLAGDAVDILDNNGNFDREKALKNLRPADLLFFAMNKGKQKNARVTHVALYMGNGEFIHASGLVRINSLLPEASNYDAFQQQTIVAAKRYLGTNDPQIEAIKTSKYY